MNKIFFFDLETTGVKYWKNGIHQISGGIVINNELIETFDFKVKPHHQSKIEQEALDIAGIKISDLEAYSEMKFVYNEIIKKLQKHVDKFNKKDKFHLAGFNNASFDNQFFRAFFIQNQDNYFGSWFWSDTFDVMVLASFYLREKRKEMPNFQLKTVASTLGINVDKSRLHDAVYDIELTWEIFKKVTNA